MHEVLAVLSDGMGPKARAALTKRADGLMRAIRFEAERRSHVYLEASAAGWSLSRLEVLCALNSFYHVVLGPLSTVGRASVQAGLATRIPIHFGTTLALDNSSIESLHACTARFDELIRHLGIHYWWLQAATGNDLLFALRPTGDPNE